MYLSDLIIVNYKSCRGLHINLDAKQPNILIGINDCGKSTILQAIGLLLDPKPKFNYVTEDKRRNDLSNTCIEEHICRELLAAHELPCLPFKPEQCVVIGKFVIEDPDINDDLAASISNHLLWVTEKAIDNGIWLARCFDVSEQKHTDYLLTLESVDEEYQNLFTATQTTLTKNRKKLGITDDEIQNINSSGRFSNLELMRAIYARCDTDWLWCPYKPGKGDKALWPEFRYLDWNISMDVLSRFINDAVENEIGEQIADAKSYAEQQSQEANTVLNKLLRDFADEAISDIPNLTGLRANILFSVEPKVTDIFVTKANADGDIHLDSQGDGVKRQIWFALLKWNALRSIEQGKVNTRFIWAFDEPETHLYPKAQREFFELIKRVCHANIQAILSTHSTIFIDRASFRNITKVDLSDGYTVRAKCASVDDIYESLQLKNSDFLFYDKFLVVEGDTEQQLIPHLYQLHTGGQTLVADNIQLINLGGKDKRKHNQAILTSILKEFKKDVGDSIVYLFDKDVLHEITSEELKETAQYYFVGRQDIEDSICCFVWERLLNDCLQGLICISAEEIENIRACIPCVDPERKSETKLASNHKFYPRVKSYIYGKLKEEGHQLNFLNSFLPSKGSDFGRLLVEYITDMSQVDPEIAKAFDALRA